MSIDKRKYVRYNANTCTEHLFVNTIEYGFDFVEGEMMKEKKRAENSRLSQETGRRKSSYPEAGEWKDRRDFHEGGKNRQKNRRKKKRNPWRGRLVVSFGLLFFGLGVCSVLMIPSETAVVEANQPFGEVQYKVIEIQSGDTLWGIARENMSPGFSDIYALIAEIRRCNQLDSDHIISGHYLMIPFYEENNI